MTTADTPAPAGATTERNHHDRTRPGVLARRDPLRVRRDPRRRSGAPLVPDARRAGGRLPRRARRHARHGRPGGVPMIRYLSGVPRKPLPEGVRLVHNFYPGPDDDPGRDRKIGLNGFRIWITDEPPGTP